jgi:hypothetical protein
MEKQMFQNDVLVAFLFMAVLFIRQVVILRQPNKLNYAPLMLGIGAISSVVHFITHPDVSNAVLLFRESLFPLLVALLLYIVMNILHQTQESENSKTQNEFTRVLVSEISQLKEFILDLETRMSITHKEDILVQEEIRSKIKDDIHTLDTIQGNQTKFFDKFNDMESFNTQVISGLNTFTQEQLPELNSVVHKHIDILRVSEQDHYNKLTSILDRAVKSRGDMSEDIESLKDNINSIKNVSEDIANSIVHKTMDKLSGVTKAFESQMVLVKTHTEGIETSLREGETTLDNIRNKSEIIMKQMILSSNKMDDLSKQHSGFSDVYGSLEALIKDVESIKSDYVKSQAQLSTIAREFEESRDDQVAIMKVRIDDLSDILSNKIDESLEKLHEHFHITDGEISQSVQMLAKRAQLKNGYTELDKK